MRVIRKRLLRPRYRKMGRKGSRVRLAAAAGAMMLLWSVIAEIGLSSVSGELTEEAVRRYLITSMDRAVTETLDNEESFASLDRSETGRVIAVTVDTAALNRLKNGVISRLAVLLNKRTTVWVPIGSLAAVRVFNGRGPSVPIRLKLDGSADAAFETGFASAGVNQSCHRIVLRVTASVCSQSKRFAVQVKEETSTVLSETVVIGEVPQAALLDR